VFSVPALDTSPDPSLSRRRKAAIVVQMLLSEGQKPPLSGLPEEVQVELTRELGSLRIVDRETLYAVAEEFARDLESVGLSAIKGIDAALAALKGHISPAAAARLKNEASMTEGLDPWIPVLSLTAEQLVPIAKAEAIEVCAVLLSKLPVTRAAELLALLPGDRARRMTYAVSQTSGVSPQAVKRIGRALALQYCNEPVPAFDSPPIERIAGILNSSQQATRDQVLSSLVEEDPVLAEDVRRAIFTFAHIPARLRTTDVPRVLRGVDQLVLVTALAAAMAAGGAEEECATFILSNMSQRMADSLREEVAARGKVKRADGESAMGAIVTEIRDRVTTGEIELISPDDDEEGGA
jgi:flagellar motor switch protein FliG